MKSLLLEIPGDVLDEARIARDELEHVLRRELAVQLYARELLPKSAARKLAGMERIPFDELLAERRIAVRLSVEDLETDLANLEAWRSAAGAKDETRTMR